MKQDRYGLGYKPNGKERKKQIKSQRDKRISNLKGNIVERVPMVFPHLRETFHSAGVEHDDIQPEQTAMVEGFKDLSNNIVEDNEVKREDIQALLDPQPSGSTYTNWIATVSLLFTLFHSN